MTYKPPREGARWGEENTKKAMQLQRFVKVEFPHLKVSKLDDLLLACEIMAHAQRCIEFAAEDGRGHSMSETLQNFRTDAADILKQNPEHVYAGRLIFYGDEMQGHLGHQKKRDAVRKEKTSEALNILVGLVILLGGAALVGFMLR